MFYIYFDTELLVKLLIFPIIYTIFIISIGMLVIKQKLRKPPMDDFTLSERIRNYKPRPLTDNDESEFKEIPVKNSRFNFAKVDFLSFSQDQKILNEVSDCIKGYGVGTCGPRGFYGSTDVHYALEESLSKFLNVQDTVVYSYGYSTVASSISCYCQVNDIIFVDALCNAAISMGVSATKSQIFCYEHNNPKSFAKLAEEIHRRYSKAKKILVLEGIYVRDGSICRLRDFVEVAKRFKVRIFIDESISFGTLGKQGKGVTEFSNVEVNEIDMIIGSLEYALHSIGGFCAGSKNVIEHQRLNSLGYVYSASLPTFSVKAALTALENMGNRVLTLRFVSLKVDNFLRSIDKLMLKSDPESPVKVFCVRGARKPVFANKLNEFFINNDIFMLVEGGYLKMNLYANFGSDPDDFDKLFNIVSSAVKEIL